MKRTRIGPGKKSIERGSTFKPRDLPPEIAKRNPRPRRGRGVSQRFPGATGFTRRVFGLYGRKCIVCGKRARQAHHVVPRQVILGFTKIPTDVRESLAYDARNGAPVCVQCHADHEGGARRIPFPTIPQGAIDWAEENGFGWYVRKSAIYPRVG